MRLPPNPHDRVYRYLAAVSPTPEYYHSLLRRHALDGLLDQDEAAEYLSMMHADMPAALLVWLTCARELAAPDDAATLKWMEEKGLGRIYEAAALLEEPASDPVLALAWKIFLNIRDRHLVEALALGHDTPEDFVGLFLPQPNTSLPVFQRFIELFHDHREIGLGDLDAWITRVVKRASVQPVYEREAHAKRLALRGPVNGKHIMSIYMAAPVAGYGLAGVLRETKRQLAIRMQVALSEPEKPGSIKSACEIAVALERLDRMAPELKNPAAERSTGAGTKFSTMQEITHGLTRQGLREAGLLAEATPFTPRESHDS